MRWVVAHESHGQHWLECGHRRGWRHTAYGPTFPETAECWECQEKRPAVYPPAQLAQYAREAGRVPPIATQRLWRIWWPTEETTTFTLTEEDG
jgi:hypothetical protein